MDSAKILCEVHGGRMIVPKNPDENDIISKILKKHKKGCGYINRFGNETISGWLGIKPQQIEIGVNIANWHELDVQGCLL